jgi:F-type H+-transporting ATPase subunit delta
MIDLSVVRRYARALFDMAKRSVEEMDAVENDLKRVDQALRSIPRLDNALRAPTVSSERKKSLLRTAFGDQVTPLTARFLQLVVERGREEVLTSIYAEYQRLANEHRNILAVDVSAAVPLSDEQLSELARSLEARTGKRIRIQEQTEPELLGGLVVRMGDTILDGSVRTRLRRLHEQMLSGQGV